MHKSNTQVNKMSKLLSLNIEGIDQEPSQPSHSYATRGHKEQYEKQTRQQLEKKAASKLQKAVRQKKLYKEGKVITEKAQIQQEEDMKSSQEKRDKILVAASQREKEAQEFKKAQEEAKNLRNDTEKQIQSYKKLIADLDKLSTSEKVPKQYFKDLRPLFIMNKKSLGTQYKVGTMQAILEQWKESIEEKENEINQQKQKQSEASKKEDKIFKSGGGTQRSEKIKTFDEIGEEKENKPRSQRAMVVPGKGSDPQFSGRTSLPPQTARPPYALPANTSRNTVFGGGTRR